MRRHGTTSGLSFLVREMAKRMIRVYATRHFAEDGKTVIGYDWKLQRKDPETEEGWLDDWETAAGTLVHAIKEEEWFFRWGIFGKLWGHDWLACDVCDQVQMCRKAAGADSARKKCIMAVKCAGYMRRMPEIFEVVKKDPPKTRKVKDPNAPKKLRGHPQEIRDEALALVDSGKTQGEAARIMAERHPESCAKLTVSTISTWRLARERARTGMVA